MRTLAGRLVAGVGTRARSGRDLVLYVGRHELAFALGSTATVLGLLPLLPFGWVSHLAFLVFAGGLSISLWLLWRDTAALFVRFSGWEFERADPAFPAGATICETELGLRCEMHRGSIFTSPELNAELSRLSTSVSWRKERFQLDGDLHRYAASLIRRSTTARRPFNGRCVRLESDLSLESLRRGDPVVLREARYFDTLCSNQLTSWNITKHGTVWPFRDDYLFVPHAPQHAGDATKSLRLQPLAVSRLSNTVGVSTLAITRDDHLLLVLQSRNSGASAELRAPSGSGSLEPVDVMAGGGLADVVVRGALRELVEECGIPPHRILGSQLLGYGRWLEHGGKPEFMAVTAVDLTIADVTSRPRWSRAEEATWTQSVRAVALDFSRLDRLTDPHRDAGSVAGILTHDETMHGAASLPLEWGLRCLAVALARDPSILDRLRSHTERVRLPS